MRPELLAGLAAGAAACALTACGSSGSDSKPASGGSSAAGGKTAAAPGPVSGQRKGGTLRVLSNEGFEHLDPGTSYFQLDYGVVYATQRPLYSFKPENSQQAVPDLAVGPPRVSPDERTVTVKLRPDVKFSPPVNRVATSADVKYAIERGFLPKLGNGYASSYFAPLVGSAAAAKGKPIRGIETPDPTTIVFRLSEPFGATFAKALSQPLTAPVPKEYAAKLDAKTPPVYDADPTKQVFTGPYVIRSYQAGRKLVLARNPNWNPKTDYRPAYVDSVEWSIGSDPNVAGRQILTGKSLISGDTPAAPIVKLGVTKYPGQINFTPSGNRYITMNTTQKPFDDVNVRKAVIAATDRLALQKTRGGRVAGDVATHFLSPGAPGFEEAGGAKGPGFDYLANPAGDMAVAASYMKKAGYPSGRYTGSREITMVGTNADPAIKTAQVTLDQFRKLGFKVNFRTVQQETMYSKFCNVPKAKVDVCPNIGWLPDFADGYAYLFPTFNGKAISPANNVNQPQLDDPKINAAMAKASETADPAARARAWGQVDRMITAQAPAIPWFWDKLPNVQSKNVQGVIARWNAAYDLSFTSIK